MEETISKQINDRFADIADIVSETMGKWWVTVLSILLVLLWLAAGPFFHYSDSWQLIVNTPTTILEMWIGFLLAAAANRVERHNQQLQDNHTQMLSQLEQHDQRMMELLTKIEKQEELLLEIRSSSHSSHSLPLEIDSSLTSYRIE